jgi:hypothetical protein
MISVALRPGAIADVFRDPIEYPAIFDRESPLALPPGRKLTW